MNSAPIPEADGKDWPWRAASETIPDQREPVGGWPRISIVTPSLNQGQYLEETIRSVLLQGYPNLEYIIIDGGSTDGSLDIIRRYEPWLSYWVSEADSGQSEAINKGFAKVTGDWLGWLNSDDRYLPDTLINLAAFVSEHPKEHWAVGVTILVDQDCAEQGRFEPRFLATNWQEAVCMRYPNGMALPQPSSFWSHEAWSNAGPLDTTLNYAMDYAFWCRLVRCEYRPIVSSREWALFRQHPQAKTYAGGLDFLKEEKQVVDSWNSSEPSPQLMSYLQFLQKKIRRVRRESLIRNLKAGVRRLAGREA